MNYGEELQVVFEEYCKGKCLEVVKVTDSVYELPEKKFFEVHAGFFLDFSGGGLVLRVRLESQEYVKLPRIKIGSFARSPEYQEFGVFAYKINSENIYEIFDEISQILEGLYIDLNQLEKTELSKSVISPYSELLTNTILIITKQKYREIFNTRPLMWFGDFHLFISINPITKALFVKCFFEDSEMRMLKIFNKKTEFYMKVELNQVLRYFGVLFHDKFKVDYRLYQCVLGESSAWEDFYAEKLQEKHLWQISSEYGSFIVNSRRNDKNFLEKCRGEIQFMKISNRPSD